MTVIEYLKQTGLSIHRLAMEAKISYVVLRPHVADGKPLGLKVAKRLEAFDPRMNAAEILGLSPPMPRPDNQAA